MTDYDSRGVRALGSVDASIAPRPGARSLRRVGDGGRSLVTAAEGTMSRRAVTLAWVFTGDADDARQFETKRRPSAAEAAQPRPRRPRRGGGGPRGGGREQRLREEEALARLRGQGPGGPRNERPRKAEAEAAGARGGGGRGGG